MHEEPLEPATLCVHAGSQPGPADHGLITPVITATAFDYTADGQVRYPRYLNTPNHRATAGKLAALEGAGAALITASGLGAISAVMLGLLRPGDHAVVLEGLYGGTTDLIEGLLKPLGIEFETWNGDPQSLSGLIRSETRLALVESPTNPLMRTIDLTATAGILNEHKVLAVIDNTFATPILQRPLVLGFDLVVHSGTKYLSGHSDLLCGAVAGGRELIDRIRPIAIRLGSSLNGQDLNLLERSLKTLGLRIERQSANALHLAARLHEHPAVTDVYYPGLRSDPGHRLAQSQMRAFGGMLSFRLAGSVEPAEFLRRLELIGPAVSLGGVESTICQPSRTSHAKVDPAERDRLGIDDRLMRLSVGIESAGDLWRDLQQALADPASAPAGSSQPGSRRRTTI